MRIELIGKLGHAAGTKLLDINLAMLVLLHCYGPLGHSIKNAPLEAMDLRVDGKLIPWPDDLAEVF